MAKWTIDGVTKQHEYEEYPSDDFKKVSTESIDYLRKVQGYMDRLIEEIKEK